MIPPLLASVTVDTADNVGLGYEFKPNYATSVLEHISPYGVVCT